MRAASGETHAARIEVSKRYKQKAGPEMSVTFGIYYSFRRRAEPVHNY